LKARRFKKKTKAKKERKEWPAETHQKSGHSSASEYDSHANLSDKEIFGLQSYSQNVLCSIYTTGSLATIVSA
jgi:hypothetical protein